MLYKSNTGAGLLSKGDMCVPVWDPQDPIRQSYISLQFPTMVQFMHYNGESCTTMVISCNT